MRGARAKSKYPGQGYVARYADKRGGVGFGQRERRFVKLSPKCDVISSNRSLGESLFVAFSRDRPRPETPKPETEARRREGLVVAGCE